ncbi:hypothetical protein HG530_003333 [Fusarium avenaceum]|nr:hypothetical protein HG530_003333 [Fusarium avenaceum]
MEQATASQITNIAQSQWAIKAQSFNTLSMYTYSLQPSTSVVSNAREELKLELSDALALVQRTGADLALERLDFRGQKADLLDLGADELGLALKKGRRSDSRGCWLGLLLLGSRLLGDRRGSWRGLVVRGNLLGRGAIVNTLEINLVRDSSLAIEPLLSTCGGLGASGRREDISLEGLGTSWHSEGDGLDVSIVDRLVSPHDFILVSLNLHADTRDRVQHGEAANGLCPARLPKSYLPLAHTGETSRRKAVVLSQPDSARVLGTAVTGSLVNGLLLSDIPHSNLLISRGGGEHATASVPCQTLDDIVVLESKGRLASADVPELDGEVTRGGGEDVFGRGVEENLSNLSDRGISTLAGRL